MRATPVLAPIVPVTQKSQGLDIALADICGLRIELGRLEHGDRRVVDQELVGSKKRMHTKEQI